MVNALYFQKMLFRTLFRLVRKHGIALVLQGLIEVAKTDEKDQRMKELAMDLKTALDRYKEKDGKAKVLAELLTQGVVGTWDNLKPGAHVKCVFMDHGRTGKTAVVIKSAQRNGDITVQWDDKCDNDTSWGFTNSFVVID